MLPLHHSFLLRTALATAGGLLLCAGLASAASTASDNASNAIYGTSGWTTGTNGGTGFGAWTIVADPNGGGEFIGNSGNNGAGNTNNGTGGNINVNGSSFGMYSSTGTSSATRPFTGALSINQTFSMAVDTGYSNNGATEGYRLIGSDGSTRFQFSFTGGGNAYSAIGSTTNTTANQGFTDNGMTTAFTLTGANAYSFTVNFAGGATDTFTGTLSGTATAGVASVQAFSTAVGTGGANDIFFNSVSIVPEPATYVWLGASLLGLVVLRRRRAA